jgi:hypothetical protein
MAENILITCPDCQKQLKGPAGLVGKKIKCKSCDHVFVVKATPPGKAGAADKPAKKPAKAAVQEKAAEAKPINMEPLLQMQKEEDDSKNPYKLTEISQSSRCPQCAADMEEGDIICLNCGYNTQTRQRVPTVMTYESTTMDWTLWLLPGILYTLVALAMVGAIVYIWVAISHYDKDERVGWIFGLKVWGSVLAAFIGWFCLKFAFKRLILNYHPPEKLMR